MKLNKKTILFVVIGVVFIALFLRYMGRAPKRHYADFRVYYATGERFLAKEDIYSRPDESITPFKYSPMFAMIMSPLSLMPKKAASLVFFSINFILVCLIIFISKKLIFKDEFSFKERMIIYGLSLLGSLRFLLHATDSGQVGIVMFALAILGIYYIEKRKDCLGSAFLGMAVLFKYTPAAFLLYYLSKRKIKIVALVCIFIIIFCFLPLSYTGVDKGITYLKNWIPYISDTSFDKGSWFDYKNQSVFSMSLRYLCKDSPYGIAVLSLTQDQARLVGLSIGIVIFGLILIPRGKSDFNRMIDYASIFIFMALFNPNAWMHNFGFLLFGYMVLLYYLFKINFKDKLTLVLVVITILLGTFTSEAFAGDELKDVFEELSSVTIASLILMFSLLRLKFNSAYKRIGEGE